MFRVAAMEEIQIPIQGLMAQANHPRFHLEVEVEVPANHPSAL
jgi:hypothetical protein